MPIQAMTDHWQWSFMAVMMRLSRLQEVHATYITTKHLFYV